MDETNFDWDDLRLFLAVARNGGLAGAANASGKSAPTLGRRMLALERRLGQTLFERLPRGYVLTAQGNSLLSVALQIHHLIDPVMGDGKNSRRRTVKLSAGTWTTFLLCQHSSALIEQDCIILQFIAAEQALDIPHREAVIGIRNQRPTNTSLAGQRINKVRFATYAINHDIETWAILLGNTPSARWVSRHVGNDARIEVSHPRNILDLTLSGVAKSVLPTFIGNQTEGLIQISEEIDELEHSQWLVTHHEDRHLPEVRRVIERLQKLLSDQLAVKR